MDDVFKDWAENNNYLLVPKNLTSVVMPKAITASRFSVEKLEKTQYIPMPIKKKNTIDYLPMISVRAVATDISNRIDSQVLSNAVEHYKEKIQKLKKDNNYLKRSLAKAKQNKGSNYTFNLK